MASSVNALVSASKAAVGQLVATTPRQASTAVKAKAAAVDFEATFLGAMFAHMFTAIDGDGPFGNGIGVGTWRSFLSDEYAKSFAKAGGVGLADSVQRALIAEQEARSASLARPRTAD